MQYVSQILRKPCYRFGALLRNDEDIACGSSRNLVQDFRLLERRYDCVVVAQDCEIDRLRLLPVGIEADSLLAEMPYRRSVNGILRIQNLPQILGTPLVENTIVIPFDDPAGGVMTSARLV